MNWVNISQDYELAYRLYLCFLKGIEFEPRWTISKLKEIFSFNTPTKDTVEISQGAWDTHVAYNNRVLYDFFDKNEIYTEVTPHYNFGDEQIDKDTWEWTLHQGELFSGGEHDNNDWSDNRTEAETKVFTRAFELLNKRLRNDTERN